jgi:3-oxoadipate enol-lactonase
MPTLNTRGARVSYSRTGTGTPVLLIQGVGAVGNAWRPQIDGLRDRFSVITFDNRGIGDSTMTDGFLTVESMADDALAILEAEGIDRCHVVGHAMGGLIAMQLALTSPGRVKSLALLCTFPDGRLGAHLTRDTFMAGLRSRIIRRQLRAMAHFDPGWRLRCLAAVRTLVVSGKEDRVARPEHGRKLAASIPGATYLELDRAGHAVSIESSTLINQLLIEHMTETARNLAS